MQPIEIQDDGIIQIRVKKAGEADVIYEADLFSLKLAFEEVENKHKVTKDSIATPEFLRDLASAAARCGIKCNPRVAFSLWPEVTLRWLDLKKSLDPTPKSQNSTESIPSNSPAVNDAPSTPTSTN